jgi:peptidoglycan/LPS O-acetylase OafA/YrhL
MGEESDKVVSVKYRPDIDGLRAVAVLSVLAFHIGAGFIRGGYVGVDVFFVISGYLISSVIFSEIAASHFSILGFYERRIRRIFPALFCMFIVFSAAAVFFLLPTEFVDFAKSLLAAATSTSNFYFWQHSCYFDQPTSNPLLHTWSLAVEEQFYILFPIFLVIVRRFFPRRLTVAVLVLFLASLTASVVMTYYYPTAAYYMPCTRAWELLLGTLVSLGIFPSLQSSMLRNLATLTGMCLIVYSVLCYTQKTPFPGIAAFVPCFGSALIIGAGQFGPSLVGRVLSWRPVVFIGLISYSLYLWHWPVIILHTMGLSVNLDNIMPHRYAVLLPPFRFDMYMEIVTSFVLAVLSWRFVERPFRRHPQRIGKRTLFALSAAVMVLIVAFSGTVIFASGLKGRFSPQAVRVASFLVIPNAGARGRVGTCFITNANSSTVLNNDQCLRMADGKKNYLLIGDSHAGSLWSGLQSSLPRDNFLLTSLPNCKPFVHAAGSSDCKEEMNYIFQNYLQSHAIQGLLLEARWRSSDMQGLSETIDWARLHRIPVMVIGPVAEYDAPLPRLLAYAITWNKPDLASQHRLASSPAIDAKMQSMADNTWHVPYVSPYQAICNSEGCVEYVDATREIPIVHDGDHLTEEGSAFVARRLILHSAVEQLKPLQR